MRNSNSKHKKKHTITTTTTTTQNPYVQPGRSCWVSSTEQNAAESRAGFGSAPPTGCGTETQESPSPSPSPSDRLPPCSWCFWCWFWPRSVGSPMHRRFGARTVACSVSWVARCLLRLTLSLGVDAGLKKLSLLYSDIDGCARLLTRRMAATRLWRAENASESSVNLRQ